MDIAPLSRIEVLPFHFLSGCRGLKEVDLSSLINVGEVDDHVLDDCTCLTRITLPPQLPAAVLSPGLRGLLVVTRTKQQKDSAAE